MSCYSFIYLQAAAQEGPGRVNLTVYVFFFSFLHIIYIYKKNIG